MTALPVPATDEFARLVAQSKLTAAVVEWFFDDADSLVMDVDEPVRVVILMEEALSGDVEARQLLGKYIALAAHAGAFPRGLCRCCGEPECEGCGGETTAIRPPARVTDLLAEVQRGA